MLLIVLLISFSTLCFSQTTDPFGNPVSAAPPPPPPDPVDTPIDGGLSLLIAAGVGYGIKKVRDERKRKKQAEI